MKTKVFAFTLAAAIGTVALCRSLVAAGAQPAPAGSVVRIELPQETVAYKPAAGVQLAQSFCMTCHSADYALIQPQMPRKFWEATVKKMKEKYGALVPEDIAPLVDYFTVNYGAK